jgi:hypothetical protein
MSACMSAYVKPAPTGRICMKFYVENFHENLSQNYIVRLKSDIIWDTSLDVGGFYIVDSDICSSSNLFLRCSFETYCVYSEVRAEYLYMMENFSEVLILTL